ncbi:MAG: phosphatidylglycerophosphatase A [Xanthomonadaceae bacterium]|nr:phosphatidylglycerophosphatase A [Xanthomonadaceae bacterium]MDE2053429.1 phosphatidylglycerophosphatase A [Xanthomonadaceae bacterium]MDE2497790.1 phosphatidylglycerophosphatase A [Xanthomonadaceae bacterium]
MSAPLTPDQRRRLLSHPAGWIATALGAGLSPKAPGTAGSLVALLPWWFLLRGLSPGVYLAVLVAGFLLGVWACDVSDRRLGMHDQGALVWDEVIGMWITLVAAPPQWWWMIIGFALFRLFDIWKPWPVSWADRRVHGGLGVMLDDVAAGVYALIVLQLVALAVRTLA